MKKNIKIINLIVPFLLFLLLMFYTTYGVLAQSSSPAPSATAMPTMTNMQSEASDVIEQNTTDRPVIILKKYQYSESILSANSEAKIILTFDNIGKASAYTVYVKIQSEGDILPSDNINQRELGKINIQKSKSISIPITIQNNAKPGPQKITVFIDYTDESGNLFSSTEEIPCQIKQPLRIACDSPLLPERSYAGDTISVPINIMNLGQSSLYNVKCTIEGQGLYPQSSLFLGTIEQGTSKSGEIFVFIGSKEDAKQEYGATQGSLKVLYEDEYGESFEQSVSLPTLVIEAPRTISTVTPDESDQQNSTAKQWWIAIVTLLIIISGTIIYFIFKRRKIRKGRHYEEN